MFYYISGELVLVEGNIAVIDVNGIGYQMTVSQNTLSKLNTLGSKVKLYTYYNVREDGVDLFGFFDKEEKDTFLLLTTVNGLGPKVAMNILSAFTPQKLFAAIENESVKEIAKAQKVGQKLAARIILELKDKISTKHSLSDLQKDNISFLSDVSKSSKLNTAQEALISLGYSAKESASALSGINPQNTDVEEILQIALKKLLK